MIKLVGTAFTLIFANIIQALNLAEEISRGARCKDCVYGEQYDEEIEDWRECRYDGCGLAYEISHFCSHGKRKDETRRKDREKK